MNVANTPGHLSARGGAADCEVVGDVVGARPAVGEPQDRVDATVERVFEGRDQPNDLAHGPGPLNGRRPSDALLQAAWVIFGKHRWGNFWRAPKYTMVKKQVEYDASLWAQRDAEREKRFGAKLKRQAQQRGYKLVPIEEKPAP